MNDKIWVRSKWQATDLHTQTVEFKLALEDGEAVGTGQFIVASNPEGLLSIDIRTVLRRDEKLPPGNYDFHLNQWAADQIEKHADKTKADFQCFANEPPQAAAP